MRDEHVVGTPRVQSRSLSATGTPARGPGSWPGGHEAVYLVGRARACSSVTRLKAWTDGSSRAMRARCSSSTALAESSPPRTSAAIWRAERAGGGCHLAPAEGGSWCLPQDPRDPETCRLHVGGLGEDLVAVQAGARDILTEDVGQRERVRRRQHALDVERLDVGRMLEHSGQLGGKPLELVVRKGEARQAGDVRYVVLGNGLGHRPIVTTPGSAATVGRQRRRYLRGQSGDERRPWPGRGK